MAIRWAENFEAGTSIGYEAFTGVTFTTSISSMYGRCVSLLRQTTELGGVFRKLLPTTYTQGLVSFAFTVSSIPTGTNRRIMLTSQDTTNQVCLYMNADGRLAVSRDTTVLGTTTNPVITAAGLRYRIEVGFTIDDTTGTVVLRVNGTELLNLMSQDTRNTAATFNKIAFACGDTGSSNFAYYDDIVFDDDNTSFRGDLRIDSLMPTSDIVGYSTPSTGANRWATIDEQPYSATDFNAFPGNGEDVYGIANLADVPTSIYGIAVNWIAKKSDTGTCDMRAKIKSGASVANGTTQTINVASQFFQDIYEVDPATSAAWTDSGVNGVELPVERTA